MIGRRDEAAVPERAVRVLASDCNLKALACVRMQDVLDEIFAFENKQHCTDTFEVLKLWIAEQLCRTAEIEAIL